MAFVLSQSASYSWPVSFDVPTDGGRHEPQTFDGQFKRLPQSRLGPIVAELQQIEDLADLDQITEIAKEILIGWDGVTGDDGKEIPYSEKALSQLLEVPLLAVSIVKSYMDSIKGAKRKN